MFEVGFSELLLIMALALIVLGPEKLPKVASQVGRWMGRARAMARQFRETLEEEVQLGETTQRQGNKPKSTRSGGGGTAAATPAPDSAASTAAAAGGLAAAADSAGTAADAPWPGDDNHTGQDDPDTRHNDYAGAAWEPPDRVDDPAESLPSVENDSPVAAPTSTEARPDPQTTADTHEQRGT